MFRLALVFVFGLWGSLVFAAEPGQAPSPSSPAPSPTASTSNDRIIAAIIVTELKALGYASTIDTDDSGDPRVNMTIDGFDWSIYFYDCAAGARDDRQCNSYQFYSGYTLKQAVSLDIINKWNTERRYAKAYTTVQRNGSHSARLEIDVRSAGTGADPARTFRIYFGVMKDRVAEFRRVVGFR